MRRRTKKSLLFVALAATIAGSAVATLTLAGKYWEVNFDEFGSTHVDPMDIAPIGVIGEPFDGFDTTVYSEWNPSLDFAPDTQGTLHGTFRVSLIAIDEPEAVPRIGLVLPSRAAVTVGDGGGGTIMAIGESAFDRYSCEPGRWPDGDVGSVSDVVVAIGSHTGERWTFDCLDRVMIAWYELPQQRSDGDMYYVIDGSNIATEGVAMATFEIPDYPGLTRTDYATWHLDVSLDSGRRPAPPLGSLLLDPSRVAAPSVSINPYTSVLKLDKLVPSDYQLIPKMFYERAPAPTWATTFGADGPEYYSADILATDLSREAGIVNGLWWSAIGAFVSALAGLIVLLWRTARTARDDAAGEALRIAAAASAAAHRVPRPALPPKGTPRRHRRKRR